MENENTIPERSAVITFIGVLMGIFAALGLLNELLSFVMLGKFNGVQMVDALAKSGFRRDWLTAELLNKIFIIATSVFLVIDALCLWAAISLVKRQSWARAFYQVYFILLIIRDIVIIGVGAISNIFGAGLTETQKTNGGIAFIQNILIATIAANMIFYIYAFFKLSSKRTKREFQPAWMR